MPCVWFVFALLLLNTSSGPIPSGPQATAVPGEFKKPVYESTFRKCLKGMSFVNSLRNHWMGLA